MANIIQTGSKKFKQVGSARGGYVSLALQHVAATPFSPICSKQVGITSRSGYIVLLQQAGVTARSGHLLLSFAASKTASHHAAARFFSLTCSKQGGATARSGHLLFVICSKQVGVTSRSGYIALLQQAATTARQEAAATASATTAAPTQLQILIF